MKYAVVWGSSAKHAVGRAVSERMGLLTLHSQRGQKVGLEHVSDYLRGVLA